MKTICRVCHRKLTSSKSVEREVGYTCYRKLRKGFKGIQVKHSEDARQLDKLLEGAVRSPIITGIGK